MSERLLLILRLSPNSPAGLTSNVCRSVAQVRRLWQDEEGKDVVEYGLLVALLSLAGIVALVTLARALGLVGRTASSATGQGVH